MDKIKKIWNKWCDMVDERNASLTYANYEEAWSYCTPFSIFVWPFVVIPIVSIFFKLYE